VSDARPPRSGGGRHHRVDEDWPVSIRPKKALGQHFLVDENILGVIGRLAELRPSDIVLEVGPGLGVLTRFLAARVSRVHAVELDHELEQPLHDALGDAANVHVAFGDVLSLDLATLEPPPSKVVSNLPYNIATPFVMESLERLPSVRRWCVMVQREVADRFFAAPRTRAYGAVSVLVQLVTRRVAFRPVPPSVFRPRPRVESALVAFERIDAPSPANVRSVVEAAFAHRRKTLANSVALVGLASRNRVEEALGSLGHAPNVRAQELSPEAFVTLADRLS
jgi:16S rRNA (adenine1518-N6/adenine1519-N6)-dimethyltransferase